MEKKVITQEYDSYLEEDHTTWSIMMERQISSNRKRFSDRYIDGFDRLKISESRIPRIEHISGKLEMISGWSLVPVTGLIPTKNFFLMLIDKKYPINVSIRRPWEIEFSEQPDIFHDVCGHLPLLTNEKFSKFLTSYSIIALKYIHNDRAVDFLGRLYWFTYEMGIITENGEQKAYGGAIIISGQEIINIEAKGIIKHPFDTEHIFNTPYDSYHLQTQYFVINSFDDLLKCLEDLEEKLAKNLEVNLLVRQ